MATLPMAVSFSQQHTLVVSTVGVWLADDSLLLDLLVSSVESGEALTWDKKEPPVPRVMDTGFSSYREMTPLFQGQF